MSGDQWFAITSGVLAIAAVAVGVLVGNYVSRDRRKR